MENENLMQPIQVEQKESIKLIKNTKGYQWEIKMLNLDIEHLERLNKTMEEKFGEKCDE